jgi:hypothetical protein
VTVVVTLTDVSVLSALLLV